MPESVDFADNVSLNMDVVITSRYTLCAGRCSFSPFRDVDLLVEREGKKDGSILDQSRALISTLEQAILRLSEASHLKPNDSMWYADICQTCRRGHASQ